MQTDRFEIFLICAPGLENALREECLAKGFSAPKAVTGGATFMGRWREVWRANLELRGAGAVLIRIGQFPASHLSELDKRARAFPWGDFFRKDTPLKIEASCSASEIYHTGAVAERLLAALDGFMVREEAEVALQARIHKNICTLSIDTSGTPLHKRGHKQAMAKAPIRETMAAALLQMCGYEGKEPIIDPLCGSGTFVIEAAEMALGLQPGRNRSFAFEQLASFNAAEWQALRQSSPQPPAVEQFFGFDRDAGAIAAATANAERAGLAGATHFMQQPLSALRRPAGPPGLVITNPPYGTRIGVTKALGNLYASFGQIMLSQFSGWQVGLVTDSEALAKATGLSMSASEPILHGGIRVRLYQTKLP